MKPIPVTKRNLSQPFVVVGCMIQKNGKYLLVQEAVAEKGTWNQPAGWLDLGEDVISGAKREAEEETGMALQIIGFLGVFSILKTHPDSKHGIKQAVKLILAATTQGEPKVDPQEIMDARWFSLEEIKELKNKNVLRDHDIISEVEAFEKKQIYPLDLIHFYNQLK